MKQSLINWIGLVICSVLMACGNNLSPNSSLWLSQQNEPVDEVEDHSEIINPPIPTDENQQNSQPKEPLISLSICSKLPFENVSWPKSMDEFEVNSYALAMNISGSFEGHDGWSNLANNFDGQGVSLGLFNQNLGQGTLQPLFNRFKKDHPNLIKKLMSSSQFNSLNKMLNEWGMSAIALSSKSQSQTSWSKDYSALDDEELLSEDVPFIKTFKASNSNNQKSVNWAVSNLYSGSRFKSIWRQSLQSLAETPEYITLQVAAAGAIHNKAMNYMDLYGFRQLRSYLFLFDIVVQNGGIPQKIEQQYFKWARQNPKVSEITKAKKLLEYRLTIVRSQYVRDVRSRKTSILDGQGVVHGARRNYVKEYCSPSLGLNF